MAPQALSDATFNQLAEFIRDKTGIFIPPTKKYLVENRLHKIIEEHNLKGYDEYLYLLKYSANGREMDRLFDAITTNETYFFREPLQFDVITDHLVPKLLEGRVLDKVLRVWSAACSSGEEPYTLGMLMREKRPDVRMDMVASDISKKVLQSAERGSYSSYSVRNVPQAYMLKYFRQMGQEYLLEAKLRSSVRFKQANLLSERRLVDLSGMDMVLCRNVLIYFDAKTKQQAVSNIYDSLRPGGFLVIGSSESLHNVTRALRPVTINKVVVYEKV